jgi:hypothetical protein
MSEASKKQSVIQGGNHSSAGLLERAVNTGADFAEKAVVTVFDVARDVSAEWNGRTLDTWRGWKRCRALRSRLRETPASAFTV